MHCPGIGWDRIGAYMFLDFPFEFFCGKDFNPLSTKHFAILCVGKKHLANPLFLLDNWQKISDEIFSVGFF